jgi:hypothetical protein
MKIYFPLKVEVMFRHFSLISFSTIYANHFPGNMYNSSEKKKTSAPFWNRCREMENGLIVMTKQKNIFDELFGNVDKFSLLFYVPKIFDLLRLLLAQIPKLFRPYRVYLIKFRSMIIYVHFPNFRLFIIYASSD